MAKLSKSQLDYNWAVKMMSRAIELAPENAEYYVERGHLYLGLEKNKKAKRDFNSAMEIDRMSVEPWIGKSLCHLYKNELDSALMVAHIAHILAQSRYEQARAGSLLGEVLYNKEDDEEAFEYFSESLQLDTTNNRGFKKAARIAIDMGNYKQAESLLLKAMENDQRDLEVLINLAYIYNHLNFPRQSLEYCNMALAFDPIEPLARSNRALAYLKLGQIDRALDDINQSIRSDNLNPLAYVYKGEILLTEEHNEVEKACKCFDTAVKLGYDEKADSSFQAMVSEHCAKEK